MKLGYDVTVLKHSTNLAVYFVTEFLNSDCPTEIVDVEIDGLKKMGVKFETNCM